MLRTKAEFLSETMNLSDEVRNIVNLELNSPVKVGSDTSLRLKVTDSCGMACTFCHNEGTPVTIDTQRITNGRVSIYESTNGVNFIADSFLPDEEYRYALTKLRDSLGLNELHFTGGEPTLNTFISTLTQFAVDEGYTVKMTSNGETGIIRIPDLARAGLESINFSIFGTTAEEIAAVQSERFKDFKFGVLKLAALTKAIESSIQNNIRAKANVVVRNDADFQRVHRIIERFGNDVEIRLLPSLDDGMDSVVSIYRLLSNLNAEPYQRNIAAGSSNIRTDFITPNNIKIGFKQINRVTLPETCSECVLNNPEECNEGYYGIRLYKEKVTEDLLVGVCIQRMDLTMPLNEFLNSNLSKEIIDLRESEMVKLQERYSKFLIQ